jgi:hypothetical protein
MPQRHIGTRKTVFNNRTMPAHVSLIQKKEEKNGKNDRQKPGISAADRRPERAARGRQLSGCTRRGCAMIQILQFLAIVLTSLRMGVHFGIWLTEAPMRETQSGPLFTEVQQGRDRVADRIMPILGIASIVSVAACVFLVRAVPVALALSLIGLALIVGDMAVTLICNVPINKKVESWSVAAPPPEWAELRDRWEKYHTIRTVLIVSGFSLFASSVVFFNR